MIKMYCFEEAEERHHVEISVYKQKLKQVLLEQQNNVTGKLNAVNTPSAVQNGHTESSLDLQRDGEAPNGVLREKKFHEMNLKELKLSTSLHFQFDVKHHERIRSLIRTEEKRRRMEMEEVEKQMRSCVVDVKEEQERALRGAEERYSAAQTRLLTEHEQLKVRRNRVSHQCTVFLSVDHQTQSSLCCLVCCRSSCRRRSRRTNI
uniref:Uncharacterized protein n=1 Tax=Salarias fasciatus TaxID=181472 RepID=A0A672HSC1_SALFA